MFGNSASRGSDLLTYATVFEGLIALLLVLILAVPLIQRIHRLLEEDPSESGNVQIKSKAKSDLYDSQNHATIMPFPNLNSPSSSHLQLDNLPTCDVSHNTKKMPELFLEKSPFYTDVNDEVPIVDDSTFDYRAYRHKLMEQVLRKYYEEHQPPGKVVMNSIHLNAHDELKFSVHDLDFFTFADDYYDSMDMKKRKEAQYLHPLDHFLVKGTRKATTEEKSIETKSPSLWSIHDVTSDVISANIKNDGDVCTPSRAIRLDYHARYDIDGRPNTPGSKLPCAIKTPKSYSQPKPFYKIGSNLQPAEILRIDKEDNTRPPTGESSSDLCSSVYDQNNDGRHRSLRNAEDKNLKRPWLISSNPDSFNRKYGKRARDLFAARWRSRSRGRESSPFRTIPQDPTQSSNASLHSESRSPSPSILNHSQKKFEVLQKVTSLSSNIENNGDRVIENASPNESFSQISRTKEATKELTARDKSEEAVSSNEQVINESFSIPKSEAPAASSPSTPRRRASRLPVHVNSMKPIGGKLRRDNNNNNNNNNNTDESERAKCEEKRGISISPTESSVLPTKSQRPKTSSAVLNKATSKIRESEEPTTKETREKRPGVKGTRPRTSDSAETKGTGAKLKREEEDNCKKSSFSSAKIPGRSKGKWKDNVPENANANTCNNETSQSVNATIQQRRISSPNKSNSGQNTSVKVAMNRGLKSYIEKIKNLLADHGKGVESSELANLSLSEVVVADLEANLSANEIRELRDILQSTEKKLALNVKGETSRDPSKL